MSQVRPTTTPPDAANLAFKELITDNVSRSIKRLTRFLPVLPLELQDAIIDELCDDKAALRTCNLVCQRWRFRAATHLFANVCISPTTVGLLPTLIGVAFSCEVIFPCVRRVRWLGCKPYSWTSHQLNIISVVFSKLAHVGKLALERLDWALLGSNVPSILSRMRNIVSLQIKNVCFPTQHDFTALLTLFVRLKSATFESIYFSDSIVAPSSPSSPLTRFTLSSGLCTVSLQGCGSTLRKEVNWKSYENAAPKNHLELSQIGFHTSYSSEASHLLRALGPRLHQLDIESGRKSPFHVFL